MHNDHCYYDIISPKGYMTHREHNGNRVLDPATVDMLSAWCAEHRPELQWDCIMAITFSRDYWSLRRGYGYGNREYMRHAARLVRQLTARPVTAFQTWSLSN